MHNPNHLDSPRSRCYKDGKCIYGYPQALQTVTTLDNNGRVIFRRRKEEDRMVVPYIPFLTELMDCHIAADITSTVNIFMYLYKYLFKGPDKTMFSVTDPTSRRVDQIKDYINARYLSSAEAAWRILSYDTSNINPSVTCLHIHLPGENTPQLGSGNDTSTASQLLRYFARPYDSEFRSLTYTEFYSRYIHYPYDPTSILPPGQWYEREIPDINNRKIISKRCSDDKIARISFVSPRQGELFYLRTLLQHKPTYSYSELCTVGDITYGTFQEAATALGLFENIAEAELCLQEAISYSYAPYNLRFLYAQLIIDIPTPAVQLWQTYKDDLCADHIQHFGTTDLAYNQALRDLQNLLTTRGSNLQSFGLPDPGEQLLELELEYALFAPRSSELARSSNAMITQMNIEQRNAFNTIYTAVTAPGSFPPTSVFYLDGRAGRGKSFVVIALCAKLRSFNLLPIITGSSALSVTMHERGRTAHATFGIPVSNVRISTILPILKLDHNHN
jgi:hypothetical protein